MTEPAEPSATGDVPETPVDTTIAATSVAEADTAEASAPKPSTDLDLIEALKQVIDPELMVNIVDLGLIYSVDHEDRKVSVQMTLTSPACPAGPQIVQQAKMALERLADVDEAKITITLSPPWTPDRMTDEAKDMLGIF